MMFQNLACAVACSLLVANPALSTDGGENNDDLTWETLETTLPKSMSDHTASLAQNGLVYIAGGCDAPLGNVWDDDAKFFFCTSLSDSFYSFDPETEIFTTLADMPRARYRHAGVAVNNQVWLVGGRDVEDNLLGEVDVYDIESGEWSTFTDLPELYWFSDNSGFASADNLYVVGGFNALYNATNMTYRINPVTSTESGTLDITEVAPLPRPRGDVPSTVDADRQYAYVGGGFSDENDFCSPLDNVDRFEFATETWTPLQPLPTPRADKVLVELDGHLFAIGGERQIEGHCELTGETPDMGELTLAVDDVEVYDGEQWNTVMSLPEHRFRFAAAGSGGTVYTFGGQQAFDDSCQCMRTSNQVVTYSTADDETTADTEESTAAETTTDTEESSANIILPAMFNLFAVFISICAALYL